MTLLFLLKQNRKKLYANVLSLIKVKAADLGNTEALGEGGGSVNIKNQIVMNIFVYVFCNDPILSFISKLTH